MIALTKTAGPPAQFAADVFAGLTQPGQKTLPSAYFYDETGSALFDAITLLPEYGLTRADERLLCRYSELIVAGVPGTAMVAELGSGNGKKSRWILEALARRQPITYYPIELSAAALARCRRELKDLQRVRITCLEMDYLEGLRKVAAARNAQQQIMVLFLGSSIGNFDPAPAREFLRCIRRALMPGDAMILSADLVKPVKQMELAYDDPAGVTAAFNLNLLARINRQLGGDFNLAQFRHHALYNADAQRIEMHLISRSRQRVTIACAGFTVTVEHDETILTENSYKYMPEDVTQMARSAGFSVEYQWADQEWPFAVTLLIY